MVNHHQPRSQTCRLLAFFGVIAVILLYLITLYNGLVSKCWANIDIALKQGHDKIPKRMVVCRQYAQFGQATPIRAMEACNAVAESTRRHDMKQLGSNESKLRSLFAQLNAVVEAYPETRADERFGRLSERITTPEANLIDRRELYNEAVNINNHMRLWTSSVVRQPLDDQPYLISTLAPRNQCPAIPPARLAARCHSRTDLCCMIAHGHGQI